MIRRVALPTLAVVAALGGCARGMQVLEEWGVEPAVSGGPWLSAAYVVPIGDGAVVIDLGWESDGRALSAALKGLGLGREDVRAVLLTHSHQDHIAAWRTLRSAPFYVDVREVPYLDGRRSHGGVIPSALAGLWEYDRPDPGELRIHPLSSDTVLAFGRDTVRVFRVPGHTPGSLAYLVGDLLFVGDALSWDPVRGFTPARRPYTENIPLSDESLAALWDRVRPYAPRWVCTAHARCGPATEELRGVIPHHAPVPPGRGR